MAVKFLFQMATGRDAGCALSLTVIHHRRASLVTASIQFAINRICGSHMPFAAFAAMARRLAVRAIELRNDLSGVEMRDGTPPADIAAIASAHGLTIRSINALQRFDQYDATREGEALTLVRYAADCGAQALVLCPTNSSADLRSAGQKYDDLVLALSGLQPLLADHGLLGLVEPLGFAECAVRRKSVAARAIEQTTGAACFALVHDTFHHHLAAEEMLFPALTGLVHASGVEDPAIPVDRMRDPHRVLVGPADRLGNVRQLSDLLAAGYAGYVSFEPFADTIVSGADIERQLASSMAYLSAALAASSGANDSSVR